MARCQSRIADFGVATEIFAERVKVMDQGLAGFGSSSNTWVPERYLEQRSVAVGAVERPCPCSCCLMSLEVMLVR